MCAVVQQDLLTLFSKDFIGSKTPPTKDVQGGVEMSPPASGYCRHCLESTTRSQLFYQSVSKCNRDSCCLFWRQPSQIHSFHHIFLQFCKDFNIFIFAPKLQLQNSKSAELKHHPADFHSILLLSLLIPSSPAAFFV